MKITDEMKRENVLIREPESTSDIYKKALSEFRSQAISFICSSNAAALKLNRTAEKNTANTSVPENVLPYLTSCKLNLDIGVIVVVQLFRCTVPSMGRAQ